MIEGATPGIEGLGMFVQSLEKHFPVYLLIFARTLGLTLQAPFFSVKVVPAQVRATLIVMLSLMYMLTFQPKVNVPDNYILFAFAFMQEMIIGALFGFTASILVSAIQAAGELIDVQMGLSMVMLFNPATKTQSSAMGRLFYQIELMVFIITGAHWLMLAAFFNTFEVLPLMSFNFSNGLILREFFVIAGKIFYVAIQLSLPVLVVLFIIDFSLGITNRVSPQINVLELNFAMKPTTGMIVVLITMSSIVAIMAEHSQQMIVDSMTMIKAMAAAIPK